MMIAIKLFGLLVAAVVTVVSMHLLSKKLEASRVRVTPRKPAQRGVTRLRLDPRTGIYHPDQR